MQNRWTNAGGSLSEGTVDPAKCAVTCPWQEGVFALETGQVLAGPPTLPVPTYQVKLEGDTVLIGPAGAHEPTVAPRSCRQPLPEGLPPRAHRPDAGVVHAAGGPFPAGGPWAAGDGRPARAVAAT